MTSFLLVCLSVFTIYLHSSYISGVGSSSFVRKKGHILSDRREGQLTRRPKFYANNPKTLVTRYLQLWEQTKSCLGAKKDCSVQKSKETKLTDDGAHCLLSLVLISQITMVTKGNDSTFCNSFTIIKEKGKTFRFP